MTWRAIVGQPLASRLLQKAVRSDRVAHAYLFEGPDGVGKQRVALELAKALNCRELQPDGDACDRCTSCRKLMAEPPLHPDVRIVLPQTRVIKTEQVRELQAEMYARPSEGRMRIAIIDGAERMNPESGNRLLKLLEEPPDYVVLVLLTPNLSGVLPTLISRCQVVHFSPLSPDQIAGMLEQSGVKTGEARLLAALSGGSLGKAAAMANDPTVDQYREETGNLLQQLHGLDDFAALAHAESLEKQKEQLDPWLDLLTAWLRDALLVAQTGSDSLVINTDRIGIVAVMADRFGVDSLLAMLTAVTETRRHLQRNANGRLALDVLMLRLCEMARTTSPI